jgi:hypothetical protein
MNTFSTVRRVFAACLFGVLSTAMAMAFEGKVSMKMTSGKDAFTYTYYVKGTKKGRSGTFSSIIDYDKMEMQMLMPEQKMYMVHRLDNLMKSEAVQKANDIEFKPTGHKEKIAGWEAEEFVGVSEGKQTEVWVTKGLGKFMMANGGKSGAFGKGGQKSPAWEKFMREGEFFPLRVVQRTKPGAPEDFRMEATAIDKTQQDDSLFRVPADYQKFEMPNMGEMFKGMVPGGR